VAQTKTSTYKGVYWNKTKQQWGYRVVIAGVPKVVYSKDFVTDYDAYVAQCSAVTDHETYKDADPRIRVKDQAVRWLRDVLREQEAETAHAYSQSLKVLLPYVGERFIPVPGKRLAADELTRDEVVTALDDIQVNRGLCRRNMCLRVLKVMLGTVGMHGKYEKSPVFKLKELKNRQPKEDKPLKPEQIQAMLDQEPSLLYRTLWGVALGCGVRISEALAWIPTLPSTPNQVWA
jgi:integrase